MNSTHNIQSDCCVIRCVPIYFNTGPAYDEEFIWATNIPQAEANAWIDYLNQKSEFYLYYAI